MAGNNIFIILPNIILVSLLLWLLSFIGFLSNKNVPNKQTKTQYECGFKTVNCFKINIFINTILSLFFLLLYEIEFVFVIPMVFNNGLLLNNLFITLLFIFSILMTFFLDNKMDAVKWVY